MDSFLSCNKSEFEAYDCLSVFNLKLAHAKNDTKNRNGFECYDLCKNYQLKA
ncbi:protein of unknown function [Methylocaldum szegediense]|uniref:Uncharacterized protein n=1 Tax=Methylocaldum szegediense TaxID=73780 RepID=A0ABM9I2X8_9GAMM|nr:protein of unknown function [Methylocaldum szegediense]